MTLRARLTAGLLVVAATLVVAALAISDRQHQVLIGQLDDRLDLSARNAERLARLGGATRVGQPVVSDLYVAVVVGEGLHALVRPSSDPALAPQRDAALAAEPGNHTTVATATGGSEWMRILAVDTSGTTLVFGLPTAPADAGFRDLRRTIVITALAVAAVMALLSWWVTRLGLRPIREMTATADAIVAGATGHRAPDYPATTEAGRLGLALNAMIDANRASEARLRRFVADASHELRTPLTTLSGYAALHERGGLSGEGELADAMARMSREARRMNLLVDDLLLLARLDEGRHEERAPVDLGVLLDDLAADLHALQPERFVTVERDDDLTVVGDEARLSQALGGLVTNAWRHTPDDRAITLVGRRHDGRVRVEVVDRGDGIAAEHLPHLFERFYRADAGRTRDRGGSGLGLAIVAAIVEAHGGTYGVRSTAEGSTFWIELPTA